MKQSLMSAEARLHLCELQRIQPHSITFVEYDDLETETTLLMASDLQSSAFLQ
jgi:hypothetical protein